MKELARHSIKLKHFTGWVFFLIGLTAFSQQLRFRNYSLEEGLSQSVVNCIYQDSKGFIWVGTQNGLNRFNGYDFTVYHSDPDDSNSLSNNWIYSVSEDTEGNLWIGTKQGLNFYDRKSDRFRRINYTSGFRGSISCCVYDVLVGKSGVIYLNTPPVLTVFNPQSKLFRYFSTTFAYSGVVEDNRIPLMEDTDGDLWVTSGEGLACFHPEKKSFRFFLSRDSGNSSQSVNRITALCNDPQGKIWVGTANGLRILDKKEGSFSNLFYSSRGQRLFGNTFIRALARDRSGNIWIGTEGGGVNRISRQDEETYLLDSYNSASNGLGDNIVLSLAIDRSENLWAGTLKGISKADLKPTRFRLYRRDNSSASVDLSGNVIASIFKNDDGKLWIGNWGQGLNIYDRKTGVVEHFSTRHPGNHHIPNDFVHVIIQDDNKNIWIGTRDGIFVFDRQKSRFVRFHEFFRDTRLPGLEGTRIFMILPARDKSYWIATQSGLFHLDKNKSEVKHFSAESPAGNRIGSNLVYCVAEDRTGNIWIATINGLDVFDPAKGKMTHFRKNEKKNSLCDNFVISLCEDNQGDMWIGTGAYVNKFIRKDSVFIYYEKKDGLPNNNIFEILRDKNNQVWFATGGGLSRFDTVTRTFRTYSVEDGLQSPEFNLRACFKSADGEVFFGGMNGFNSFYPGKLADNSFIPNVVITSCYKPAKEGKEVIPFGEDNQVELNYRDEVFTIEFVALEFTNPEKNQYAYLLEGVSSDWINIGNRRFVPFSNLSPGEYTFRVRACNNDGIWNEQGARLRFIILPPWYRTIWAWISYILVLLFLLFLFIRRRERTLVAERNLLETKVHERTLMIEEQNREILQKNETLNHLNQELQSLNKTKDKFFSIIAHDLRNPFNSIIGLTDILLSGMDAEGDEKTRKSIGDIREASRHAFDLLQNLLIWARTQTGNLEFSPSEFDLTERIEDNIMLVQAQAAKKSIILVNHTDLPMMIKGDIQMINTILRNLLTNAIKFTRHEGKVEVSATQEDGGVIIRVSDNGVGITPEIMSKMFRLESKYTHKGTDLERGSGLGLILCKEFAEKHGGTITVESEEGKGSCFSVVLPSV